MANICERQYNGFINFSKIWITKNKIILENLSNFRLYQVYNECNKKINSQRFVFDVKLENYDNVITQFNKRTIYLQYERECKIKQICFELLRSYCCNNKFIWMIKPITNIKNECGKNVVANLDAVSLINFKVKKMDGISYNFNLNQSTTIIEIKNILSERLNVPIDLIKLIKGSPLDNNSTLKENNIKDNDSITMIINLRAN